MNTNERMIVMRKSLLTLFTMVVIGVLAGCSIPIGDGELTISSDGIDFDFGDEDTELADNDMLVNTPDEDEDMFQEDDEAEDPNDMDIGMENEEDQMDGNNQGQQGASGSSMCNDPQDHSALVNNIGEPFFFPECAVITNQSLSPTETEAYLNLPNTDWQDVAAEYREALSQYDVKEDSNFDNKQIQFNFQLDEDLWGTSRVRVTQKENDVEIYVRIYTE